MRNQIMTLIIPLSSIASCGGGGSSTLQTPTNGSTVSVFSSSSFPTNDIGSNGDYFFNESTGQLFGPKVNNVWPYESLSLVSPGGSNVKLLSSEGSGGEGNVLFFGNVLPTNDVGNDGDFYLSLGTSSVFGPKTNGVWEESVGTNVEGRVTGSSGDSISFSQSGYHYTDSSDVHGQFRGLASSATQGPKGDKGEKGPAGPAGPKGEKGPAGPAGPKGEKGNTGSTGPAGPAGAKGEKGAAGAKGDKGEKGPSGPAGPKGDRGVTGLTGPAGTKGDKGDQGDQGLKGDTGDKGDQGLQGPQGIKGDTGTQGIKGDTGDKGDQGLQGPQGIQGTKGDKGDQGDQGLKGDRGDQGLQGPQGIQGIKGDTGDQGEQGIKGDTGDQGIQGIKGDTGDKGDQGLKGDRGDQGLQGPQGIQGTKGDKGDQGEQGIQGPVGPAGINGTFQTASVTTATKWANITANSYTWVTASCTPPTKAISGGCHVDGSGLSVVSNIPATSLAGWQCKFFGGSSGVTVATYANCA